MGLCCTKLKQFESAEEYFISALDTFKKYEQKQLINKIKHNLGLLYADQNLSELAIKHLSDSLKDNPKTTFLLAREYYKLGKHDIAEIRLNADIKLTNLKNINITLLF